MLNSTEYHNDKDEEEEEGGVDVEKSLSHDGKEKGNNNNKPLDEPTNDNNDQQTFSDSIVNDKTKNTKVNTTNNKQGGRNKGEEGVEETTNVQQE